MRVGAQVERRPVPRRAEGLVEIDEGAGARGCRQPAGQPPHGCRGGIEGQARRMIAVDRQLLGGDDVNIGGTEPGAGPHPVRQKSTPAPEQAAGEARPPVLFDHAVRAAGQEQPAVAALMHVGGTIGGRVGDGRHRHRPGAGSPLVMDPAVTGAGAGGQSASPPPTLSGPDASGATVRVRHRGTSAS